MNLANNSEYKVFVGNLSYDTNWKSLKDYFRQIGDVLRADVFEDDRGRSKGVGIVEFKFKDAVPRAIRELNGQELDGRAIYVREVGKVFRSFS